MGQAINRFGLLRTALVAALIAVILSAALSPSRVAAHPLGNFTVNLHSQIDVYANAIRIRYVVDMAEIPTFQEMGVIDANGDGKVSKEEEQRYLVTKADDLRDGLSLSVNGERAPLAVVSEALSFPPGQGGLDTLRLAFTLETSAAGETLSVDYRDDNYADRLGWREIVVRPAAGVTLLGSTTPTQSATNELRTYPDGLLSSPLDVRVIRFSFQPGSGELASVQAAEATGPGPDRSGNPFTNLITVENLTLPVLLVVLAAAAGFGALHALEPGHGKTFVAAYFVGVRGTARHALSLGLVIAISHTLGVFAIGLVVLFGSKLILPEQLYPWLGLISGMLIVALGLWLLISRIGGLRLWHRVAHARAAFGHHHGHVPPPSAGPRGVTPWKSLIALGLADGLTPSPSTLVVLLAAISLNRIGVGLLLIFAFSVGMGAVLTLLSLALVYAPRILRRLRDRGGLLHAHPHLDRLFRVATSQRGLLRMLPVAGAFVLISVGLLYTVRALLDAEIHGI